MNQRKIKLSAITAISENNVIGIRNELPWHLPDDLKHFREITLNKCVLMGHKTYNSILKSLGHPLKNRFNIVITRDEELEIPNIHTVNTLQQAVNLAFYQGYNEIIIIGGEMTYWLTLPRVKTLYLTRVHTICNGSVYFPWHELDPMNWQLVESIHHAADENHLHPFTFLTYERK